MEIAQEIKINHANKINRLYGKLNEILRLYISMWGKPTRYSVNKEIKLMQNSFGKNTSADRKINVMEEVMMDTINRIEKNMYPDDVLYWLHHSFNVARREVSTSKFPYKLIDDDILDIYERLLPERKESLLIQERSFYGRFRQLNEFFSNELIGPYAIGTFNNGFYGVSKDTRVNTLNRFGGQFKKNESLSPYLDSQTLALRVAALQVCSKYISEVVDKYNRLNENNEENEPMKKLGQLDFEITLMKIWILANRAYNVCMRDVRTEPLQTVLNTADQLYMKEAVNVHNLKDTRPKAIKDLEHQAIIDNLTKKKEQEYEKAKAAKEGKPLKNDEDKQLMISEVEKYIKAINPFNEPVMNKRSKK